MGGGSSKAGVTRSEERSPSAVQEIEVITLELDDRAGSSGLWAPGMSPIRAVANFIGARMASAQPS